MRITSKIRSQHENQIPKTDLIDVETNHKSMSTKALNKIIKFINRT